MTNNKGFSLDFDSVHDGYEDITDGTYEVVIEAAYEDANETTGSEFVNFQYVVRNDLDQEFKNQKIWQRYYRARATGEYHPFMFNAIGKAIQLKNGSEYPSLESLLDDFENKPLSITVKNEKSTGKDGTEYDNLNVKQWNHTKFLSVQHQFASGNKGKSSDDPMASVGIDISDDDMPF